MTQQSEGKELTKEEKQRLRKEKKQQKKNKEKRDDKASQESEKEKKPVSSAAAAPQPPVQSATKNGAFYLVTLRVGTPGWILCQIIMQRKSNPSKFHRITSEILVIIMLESLKSFTLTSACDGCVFQLLQQCLPLPRSPCLPQRHLPRQTSPLRVKLN